MSFRTRRYLFSVLYMSMFCLCVICFRCLSMLCIFLSRKPYQHLVFLLFVFVVLFVIIVFTKVINIVFYVRIIIIIIVISKHQYVRNRLLSTCCLMFCVERHLSFFEVTELFNDLFSLAIFNIVVQIDWMLNER